DVSAFRYQQAVPSLTATKPQACHGNRKLNSTLTSTSQSSTCSLFFLVHLCVEVISPLSTSYPSNVYTHYLIMKMHSNTPFESLSDYPRQSKGLQFSHRSEFPVTEFLITLRY
ncbi:unnamed protein product, partial [Clonostachys solani]